MHVRALAIFAFGSSEGVSSEDGSEEDNQGQSNDTANKHIPKGGFDDSMWLGRVQNLSGCRLEILKKSFTLLDPFLNSRLRWMLGFLINILSSQAQSNSRTYYVFS